MPEPRWGRTTILRQTSQYSGIIDDCTRYYINPDSAMTCDYVLLGDANISSTWRSCGIKVVYAVLENPEIWMPSKSFLEHVDIVVTPYDLSSSLANNTKQIISHTCVPWFYGISFATDQGLLHHPLSSRLELDAMTSLPIPKKSRLLSIVVSNKGCTRGHRWRKELAVSLRSFFGNQIDIYGFGHNPISDKRHAIDRYAYTIVVENEVGNLYVTEKIVDSLLGWSCPIYSGSPMIEEIIGGPVPQIEFGGDIDSAVKKIAKIVSNLTIDYGCIRELRNNALKRLNLMSHVPYLLSNV